MPHTYDVLVCGGGCAGMGAAISAARAGARTLMIERAPFAGGIITAVGLPFMDGIACWYTNRLVVRGLALECLVRQGATHPQARTLADFLPHRRVLAHGSALLSSTEEFKVVADEMLHEAGVEVLYHSQACGVEMTGSHLAHVIVANKDGLTRIAAHTVIDATGDADVAHWAGCPMDPSQERMPMTLHFRIGNVRWTDDTTRATGQACAAAQAQGSLPHYYGPCLNRFFAPDEVYVHAVRVPGNACDARDLSRCEIQGRRDALTMFRAWKAAVDGFENSYFISSGPYIGVRETRRIAGEHVLCEDDLRTCRRFPDAVATGSWYTDIHPNHTSASLALDLGVNGFKPRPYDIPYRALQPRGVDNLLVAGRCHSASRVAASSTRVTVTAMALGEAAGLAGAMAATARCSVADLSGAAVGQALTARGGGAFTVPTSDTGIHEN